MCEAAAAAAGHWICRASLSFFVVQLCRSGGGLIAGCCRASLLLCGAWQAGLHMGHVMAGILFCTACCGGSKHPPAAGGLWLCRLLQSRQSAHTSVEDVCVCVPCGTRSCGAWRHIRCLLTGTTAWTAGHIRGYCDVWAGARCCAGVLSHSTGMRDDFCIF